MSRITIKVKAFNTTAKADELVEGWFVCVDSRVVELDSANFTGNSGEIELQFTQHNLEDPESRFTMRVNRNRVFDVMVMRSVREEK